MPNKDDKMIMVVRRGLLLPDGAFEGFRPASEINYESRILGNFEYQRRGNMEADPSFKQPIPYTMLVNPEKKTVYVYRRADGHDEEKLAKKMSWGIGGHIEKRDENEEDNEDNPIHAAATRELSEETSIRGRIYEMRPLGYVNTETEKDDGVHRVHFGILYVAETDAVIAIPTNPKKTGRMEEIASLDEIMSNPDLNVEEWSRIALQPLKEYFSAI